MLVSGSIELLGFFFFFGREMRIARGDGLQWRSVGFGFVEYRGIDLLVRTKKNSNRDLEEGRDRRRLKLSTLTGDFLK